MAWQFFSRGLTILGLAVILTAPSARAQSGPPTSQGQEQQQPPPDKPTEPNPSGPPQQSSDSSADSNVKSPLPLPPELEVRPIGSSTPMPTYDTLLRWGPLYVKRLSCCRVMIESVTLREQILGFSTREASIPPFCALHCL